MTDNRRTRSLMILTLWALSAVWVASTAQAAAEGRLWLPKKYQHAMVKLENTAYLAGLTERCTEVIAGKIDHSKSSPENYHFVITCRDYKRRSFNMIYNYAYDASSPVLVFEQQRPEPEPEPEAEIKPAGMAADEAWLLCIEALKNKTKNMIDVLYLEEQQPPDAVSEVGYDFTVPFEAKNPGGNRLKFNGVCKVLAEGATTLKIKVR